jgi:DNA-binding NtrC family response regulator
MQILIVDDEPSIRRILRMLLRSKGHQVSEAGDGDQALAAVAQGSPDVILLDLQLPGRTGVELLPELIKEAPAARVVMMTAYGSIASAVEAMRQGAWDYLTKPFDNDELLARLARIEELHHLSGEVTALRAELESRYGLNELVGASPRMAAVFSMIRKVGPLDATVLVQGESGTGKELVARAVHRISPRSDGPFIAVNCGAIPEKLVEDTFFGHVRGAFTDAHESRLGVLEQAAGGTLFLDEIADLPLESQAALLRVLQDGSFSRIGEGQKRTTDLRLICASNVDLEEAVSSNRFREDLFWRLNVITIRVPPLRERAEDIPALADHLLGKWADQLGVAERPFSTEAMSVLQRYRWPGNVRELENTVYRALVMAEGEQISLADLPPRLGSGSPDGVTPTASRADASLEELTNEAVDQLESVIIRERLQRHRWSRSRTAESLGISRKTLFNKMKRYGITGEGATDGGGDE